MNNVQLKCTFCEKICKNKNSLAQHQIRCPKNPSRIQTTIEGFNNKGRAAWNKGLDSPYILSDSTKEKLRQKALEKKESIQSSPQYQLYKQRMREMAIDRGLGGFHFRRGTDYKGIKLDSSYEVAVAQSLDANGVRWQRCTRFTYIDLNGVTHTYTPDFYLPDYNIYLDPKNDYLIQNGQLGIGYTDVEKIKWVCEQNNIQVIVLDKDNLTWERIYEKIRAPLAQ